MKEKLQVNFNRRLTENVSAFITIDYDALEIDPSDHTSVGEYIKEQLINMECEDEYVHSDFDYEYDEYHGFEIINTEIIE